MKNCIRINLDLIHHKFVVFGYEISQLQKKTGIVFLRYWSIDIW